MGRWLFLLAFLAVALLLAWQPLLHGLPWQGDGLLHLYRLADLERAVRAGDWFPRWSADLGYGFGFPLFNYYAPFSYYVGLLPRLAGLPLSVALQISYALALLTLAAGVFLWARTVWGDEMAGATAVLATLYTPYILYNTYHRAALAELWGLAWLTMAFWAIASSGWRAASQENPPATRHLLLVTLSITFLLLSHNITALLGLPILLIYALLLQFRAPLRSQFTIHNSQFTILLGLALAAFFWLPAFFEKGYVQIENLTATANFAYTSHFLSLSELLSWPQTAVPTQINPPIPRSLSWPALILALLAWLPTRRGEWRVASSELLATRYPLLATRLFLTLLTLGSLFMTLPASQFIWDAVPLLAFVQFPWRFLGPATLGLGMLAGLGGWNLVFRIPYSVFRNPKSETRYPRSLFTVYCLLFTVFSLPWLFPAAPPPLPQTITPSDSIRFEIETGWLGTTSAADYLPRAVQELPSPDSLIPLYEATPPDAFIPRLDESQLPVGFTLYGQQERYNATTLSYNSPVTTTAVFHRFFFPGWQATLDDQPLELTVSQPHGLITAVLPPGNHTLHLTFTNTPLRTAANALSWVSLLLAVSYKLLAVSRKPHSATDSQFTVHTSPFTIHHSQFILLFLFLFTIKTFYLDHANTPFRQNPFDGRALTTATIPAQANFGDDLMLLGYDLPDQPIPADQPLNLALYWRALLPVDREISVSVQLLSTNHAPPATSHQPPTTSLPPLAPRRYAQSDSFHPAGLPVPRWQPDQFAIDQHHLELLPAAPPGDYQLVLYVYDTATGQRLNWLNEAGLPLGNEYPLGLVAITAPTTFADPADVSISHRTDSVLADNVQLLGFDQPLAAPEVGQTLPLTLFWHTPQSPTDNHAAELWLDCAGAGIVSRQSIAAPGSVWLPGQLQRTDVDLLIAPLTENGRILPPATTCALTLQLDQSEPVVLQTLPVTAPARIFDLPAAATPLGENLADLVTLAGYELPTTAVSPGQPLTLTLYWQPQQPTPTSYTAFVQLIGPDGRPLAQQDQIPANGTRPTPGWLPGEIIADAYALTLPADAPPGNYQLITGLYDGRTGERLPLTTRNGDAIVLPPVIEVKQR
jgi:hypothetical protein